MPYLDTIKANTDIFEQIKFINVQNKFVLKPILPDLIDTEAMIYMVNAQSDGVKQHLPGAYVSTNEEAKKKLLEYIDRMISYVGILYCIRPINEQIPIGYIMLNSPTSNTGIPEWTIDFWMNNRYRHRGILAASLSEVLQHLQRMDVTEVFALVDKTNEAAIRILEYFEFEVKEIEKGRQRYVYSLRLIF